MATGPSGRHRSFLSPHANRPPPPPPVAPPVERTTVAAPDEDAIRAALKRYSREFLLLISPRGEIVQSSEEITLGYRDERMGHHIGENLHPDDLPRVFDLIERARATKGFEETIRVRARGKRGEWHSFDATVIDATHDPVLKGAVLRVREIDAREVAAALPLAGAADRFLSLAEALPLGILSADARGHVVFCNESAQQIFNLPADRLMGRGFEAAVAAADRPDVVEAAGAVLRTGLPHQVTFTVETGLFHRWAHAKFVPLGVEDRRTGWIATVEDVTDRRRAESQLAFQATHDPLTGLPNRMLLEDRLGQACSRLRRDGDSVTVLFVDLDLFKDVNDTYGHRAGDQVLIEVARRLGHVTRDVDTVARLGGDEFVVVCEALPPGEAERIAGRITDAVAVPMLVDGHRVTVGASVGIATTVDGSLDIGDLLARADQDMYRSKQDRHAHG